MEIQSLVKSGKMQRIKSNAVLQNARSSMVTLAARPLDRKVSINTGALHPSGRQRWSQLHVYLTCDSHLPNSQTRSDHPIPTCRVCVVVYFCIM